MASETKVKKKGVPLSRYFQDLDDSDIVSDESGDESALPVESTKSSNSSGGGNQCDSNRSTSSIEPEKEMDKKTSVQKLPSASECFKSISSPAFLKLNQKNEVNWDSKCKNLEQDEPITEYKTNAVPPPSSYEPVTDPGIKVVDSEGRKRKSTGDEQTHNESTKAYKVENFESPNAES